MYEFNAVAFFVSLALGFFGIFYYYRNSKIGYAISEKDLKREVYIVLSVTSYEDKDYFLLMTGTNVLTCCVDSKVGLTRFVMVKTKGQTLAYIKPKAD